MGDKFPFGNHQMIGGVFFFAQTANSVWEICSFCHLLFLSDDISYKKKKKTSFVKGILLTKECE